MVGIGTGLLVLAYLLAVVDGVMQDKGSYPSSPGRTGFRLFWGQHPYIVTGAVCGIVGTVLVVIGS
jgi:hypothetical protein